MVFLALACSPTAPAWAINHASIVPDATGFAGTQTWEFFSSEWSPEAGDRGYLCARVQRLTGVLAAAPACDACDKIYSVTVEEIDGDCSGEVAEEKGYATPVAMGVGEVADELREDAPHRGRSMGWYFSTDGEEISAFGWAWDEALDRGDDAGPPGLVADRAYTLWPANAWQL